MIHTCSRGVRRTVATAALALAGLSLTACSNDSSSDGNAVVGFYPLEFVTSSIAGDKMKVENLAQPGSEPHDMELTAKQIGAVGEAKVVVYEKGMQPALDDAINNEKPKNSIDVATVTQLMDGYEELGHDDEHAGEGGAGGSESAPAGESQGGDEHAHEGESTLDPHIWLDPSLMVKIAGAVKDELVKVDGANKDTYEKNFKDLSDKLTKLDSDFKTGLASCQRKSIVTTHNAFGYLAKAYGLEQTGIAGLAEEEPSPQKLAEVKQFVQQNGVTTIFYEEAVSDKYAKTIADETGAKTAVLNPLEVKPESGDYISAMEENLKVLRDALSCS